VFNNKNNKPVMLENLLETTKALCTRDFFQRHLGSAAKVPVCYMHEFCNEGALNGAKRISEDYCQ